MLSSRCTAYPVAYKVQSLNHRYYCCYCICGQDLMEVEVVVGFSSPAIYVDTFRHFFLIPSRVVFLHVVRLWAAVSQDDVSMLQAFMSRLQRSLNRSAGLSVGLDPRHSSPYSISLGSDHLPFEWHAPTIANVSGRLEHAGLGSCL